MNNAQQTARVGLFFLLGLALTWVTFETLSGGKSFKHEGYVIIAGFESLKELKQGDQVRMAGVRIGEVKATRLAKSGQRAEALLSIDPDVRIKQDAKATIVMEGLIGTNYVGIDLGTTSGPDLVPESVARAEHRALAKYLPFLRPEAEPVAEIRTVTSPDLNSVMKQIGQLGQKLEDSLGDLGHALSGDGTKPGLIQRLDTMVSENQEKISTTMTNIRDITDKVNKGEGTLGRLVSDPKLHDELVAAVQELKAGAAEAKSFVANAQSIIDEVKRGQGVVGALVFDQKAGDDIKASLANLRTVSDKLSRGEGTLGKLLSDETVLKDVQALMKKADRALDGLYDTGPITAAGVVASGLF